MYDYEYFHLIPLKERKMLKKTNGINHTRRSLSKVLIRLRSNILLILIDTIALTRCSSSIRI